MISRPNSAGRSVVVGNDGNVGKNDDDDDGWLIAQFFDADTSRSGFFIFDSANLTAGPTAKLWLRAPLPSSLHGTWVSGQTTH